MKIDQTNIADFMKVGGNKRKQLAPKQKSETNEPANQEKKVKKVETKLAKKIQQAKR